jgi:hypothetical protein
MAHERFDVGERERLDGEGAERVPQVVEANLAQAGALQGLDVAPPESGALQVLAHDVHEHEVLVADPPLALAQPVQRRGGLVDERDGPDQA